MSIYWCLTVCFMSCHVVSVYTFQFIIHSPYMLHTHMREHTHTYAHLRLAHATRRGKNQAQEAWLKDVKAASWLEVQGLVLLPHIHTYTIHSFLSFSLSLARAHACARALSVFFFPPFLSLGLCVCLSASFSLSHSLSLSLASPVSKN